MIDWYMKKISISQIVKKLNIKISFLSLQMTNFYYALFITFNWQSYLLKSPNNTNDIQIHKVKGQCPSI